MRPSDGALRGLAISSRAADAQPECTRGEEREAEGRAGHASERRNSWRGNAEDQEHGRRPVGRRTVPDLAVFVPAPAGDGIVWSPCATEKIRAGVVFTDIEHPSCARHQPSHGSGDVPLRRCAVAELPVVVSPPTIAAAAGGRRAGEPARGGDPHTVKTAQSRHLHRGAPRDGRAIAELTVVVEPPTPERPVRRDHAVVVDADGESDGRAAIRKGDLYGRGRHGARARARSEAERVVDVVAPAPELRWGGGRSIGTRVSAAAGGVSASGIRKDEHGRRLIGGRTVTDGAEVVRSPTDDLRGPKSAAANSGAGRVSGRELRLGVDRRYWRVGVPFDSRPVPDLTELVRSHASGGKLDERRPAHIPIPDRDDAYAAPQGNRRVSLGRRPVAELPCVVAPPTPHLAAAEHHATVSVAASDGRGRTSVGARGKQHRDRRRQHATPSPNVHGVENALSRIAPRLRCRCSSRQSEHSIRGSAISSPRPRTTGGSSQGLQAPWRRGAMPRPRTPGTVSRSRCPRKCPSSRRGRR